MKNYEIIKEKMAQGYYFKEVKAIRNGKNYRFYELLKKVGEGTYNIVCHCGKNVPKMFYAPIIERAIKQSILSGDWHIPQSNNVIMY